MNRNSESEDYWVLTIYQQRHDSREPQITEDTNQIVRNPIDASSLARKPVEVSPFD